MKSIKFYLIFLISAISLNLNAQDEILSTSYGPPPEANTWHKFTIPITAETFGVESNVFQASMQNITLIRIRTEMRDGDDKCGVDSIAFGSGFLSTFDNGTDGWSALGDGTMAWESSGGVTGGYITIEDWASGDWHWATAPASWSGDLSAYIGENLTFYYKTDYPDYSAVVEFHTGDTKRIILTADKQTITSGESIQLGVTLSPTPTEDISVSLDNSDTDLITLPSTAIVHAGESTTYITVLGSENISAGETAVITASSPNYLTTRISIIGSEENAPITTLFVNGSSVSDTIDTGEAHWYQFQVFENCEHYIETYGDIDTYMRLFESNGTTQITYNDDGGTSHNAKITATLTPGLYKVKVTGYSSSDTGPYSVDVKSETGNQFLPPANVTAGVDPADANDIILNWDIPSSGTPSYYNIYHSLTEDGTFTNLGTVTTAGARIQDNQDGTHWFYVTAVYNTNESTPSNKAFATVGEPVEIPEILSVDYGPPAAADTWHKFSIPLTAETFGVETAVFQASMQSITMIRIATEMHDGPDKCGVDSIAFGNGLLSTFDSGTDGWSALGDGTMDWEPSGGVSGGYITIEDWASGDWHYATAPASWAGDLSDYIGQNFTFYYKTNNPSYNAFVELHTGDTKRIILVANPQSLPPGGSSQLDVSLSETPVEDVTVSLSSSNSGFVSIPSSITIPSGASSASVTINASQNFEAGDEVVITATATGYLTTRVTVNGQSDEIIKTLLVDSPAFDTTLAAGAQDWYQFQASSQGIYIIQTYGLTDTYMQLYENDGTSLITFDDDGGDGSNAKITRELMAGWYKVKVSGYSSSETGNYSIDVKMQTPVDFMPPQNLVANLEEGSDNTIILEWDPPSQGSPNYYSVYFSSSENGNYTLLGSVTSAGARVTNNPDGENWFYVTAVYDEGESDPSNKAFVTIGEPIEIPEILSVDYGPPATADTWEKFTIPLTAETFGLENDVFAASMRNITLIRIRTEMHSGDDKCGVDSIALGSGLLSTFDHGTENWSAMGDGTMSWEQAGGVTGGFITIEDWATGDWHWATAPASWSGNLSAYIGQNFTFYYKTNRPSYSAVVEFHTGDAPRIILSADKQTLAAGESSLLQVSLTPTPSENVTVNLSSSNPSKITLPANVTILAGESSASVTLEATQNLALGDEVVITATTSGYETTRITLVGANTTAISDYNSFNYLILYPNPTTGKFKIRLKNNNESRVQILIYNILGKEIYTAKDIIDNEFEINLNDQPAGIFNVQVIDGQKVYNKKLIVN